MPSCPCKIGPLPACGNEKIARIGPGVQGEKIGSWCIGGAPRQFCGPSTQGGEGLPTEAEEALSTRKPTCGKGMSTDRKPPARMLVAPAGDLFGASPERRRSGEEALECGS